MKIVYYITSHGYGHGVRSVAIVNALSPRVHVTFRTTLSEQFFREEITRSFSYAPPQEPFDCGCVQNDCLSIDRQGTLALYRSIAERNRALVDEEATWCRNQGADVVVSDITPFAFDVAARAGIPSVGVSNFTWYDIYNEYVPQFPEYRDMVETMREQYARATLMCALTPALHMDYFPRRAFMPVTGRRGQNRRKEIAGAHGLDPDKRLGLIYFGHFGLDGVDFGALAQLAKWEFLGIFPVAGAPANYRFIHKTEFAYQDLVASVDAMICKMGYGAVSECMLHGTPLVYPPRPDFAEFDTLDRAAREWGGGYRLSEQDFRSVTWNTALDKITAAHPLPSVGADGAAQCAAAIEDVARNGL